RAVLASHPPPSHLRTASISSKPTSISAFVAFCQIASSLRKWKSGINRRDLEERVMAVFTNARIRFARPSVWFDQLAALLTRELAPSSRKFRTAFRLTTVATIGAGLVVSCHVNNELGTYLVWLLVGAGPMMSFRKAGAFLIAEALALIASVVMAGIFAE